MNTNLLISLSKCLRALLAGACVLTGCAAIGAGATNATTKPGTTAATTKTPASASIEIPKSEFTIPGSATQGRDPFFPNRTAGNATTAAITNSTSEKTRVSH